MLTRQRVRRGMVWAGVVVGAVSAIVCLVSGVLSISHVSPSHMVWIGGGAITTTRPGIVPPPGMASSSVQNGWSAGFGIARNWWVLPRWHEESGHERIVFPLWIPIVLGLYC